MDEADQEYKLPVIKLVSHWDVMYSNGNIVNHIALILYGNGW